MSWLTVEQLSFRYPEEDGAALKEVSFTLEKGDLALLCGATGCGKSTLLRLLKRELAPRGERKGSILLGGRSLDSLSDREAAETVGFVAQRPEEQIVTDRVWHELAFGLENLGCPPETMRRRVAETAAFFGLESWFDFRTDDLSGGQKQLLNLAAVTVMQPELLILDEPTARLDPIAATTFLAAVERLNRETGMTVLMAEHRMEEALPAASRLLILREGRIAAQGDPRRLAAELDPAAEEAAFLPAPVRLWRAVNAGGACPLSVGEGRAWLEKRMEIRKAGPAAGAAPAEQKPSGQGRAAEAAAALSFREVCFRFTRKGTDILRSASLTVRAGEIFCLLGGNGSGKTTALRAAAGLIEPYSGEIRLFGRRVKELSREERGHHGAALLPQDVQALFLRGTVREELKDAGFSRPEEAPFGLGRFADRHPYDLSGGEQQLLALTRVLAARPRLLLLDEPTNGLDARWRRRIAGVLKKLQAEGMTILAVTHDPEFAAETADRCALFFRGSVLSPEEPHAFFASGSYYTTAVSRMTRGLLPDCLTVAEAAALCPAERTVEP